MNLHLSSLPRSDMTVSNELFKVSAPYACLDEWTQWHDHHSAKIDGHGLWPIHFNYWLQSRGLESSIEILAKGKWRFLCRFSICLFNKCHQHHAPDFWNG